MKYQYLKLAQIIILSVASINDKNSIQYIVTIIASVIPNKFNIFSSILSFLLMGFSLFLKIQIWKIIGLFIILMSAYFASKRQNLTYLDNRYIIPVLLTSISLASISQNLIIRLSNLFVFFIFIVLTYFCQVNSLIFPISVLIPIWMLQGLAFSSLQFGILSQTPLYITYKDQWCFIGFSITISCAIFILDNLFALKDQNQQKNNRQSQKKFKFQQINQEKNIQMVQISKKSQKKEDDLVQQLQQPLLQKNVNKPSQNLSIQQSHQNSIQIQSQSLNLILILPFLCQDSGIIQIPLYVYFLFIHYNKNCEKLFLIVLFCIFIIINNASDFMENKIKTSLLLRLAVVLMINKNVRGIIEVTQIIKKVWLKSSFVFVLVLLFWYSLITVNIFHLTLTIILLIFIVTDSKQHDFSYRHRNWVYLLSFFNIFLILRFIFELLVHYQFYYAQYSDSMIKYILDLSGVSYYYLQNFKYFNLIPLISSTAIAFQYLTYQSRIYNVHHARPLLPLYEQKITFLIRILTILYYKLIPWLSYILIIGSLLILQFSCTSLILLIWILTTICFQICYQNSLSTYIKIYKMWIVYSRILAFQIIIRYAFQFLNFPILLKIFQNIPFFQNISNYKQFLGLAIRQSDFVYFKAISKFQLMVGLDLICIFICYLIIQYYTYLIVYYETQNQQISNISRLRAHEQQRIKQIYSQFIDFKLTHWLKGFNLILKYFSEVYLIIYYPLISIYSCLFPQFSFFLMLIISIKFYLRKNTGSYQKYIQTNLIPKVKDLFLQWKKSPKSIHQKALSIYDCIKSGKHQLKMEELLSFEKLRKYLLFIVSTSLIFNYFSRVFNISQIYQLTGQTHKNQLIYLRWLLFINGTSIDSKTVIFVYLLLLFMTILQVKCCRFLIKIQKLIQKRSSHTIPQQIVMSQQNKKQVNQESPIKKIQDNFQDGQLLQNIRESKQNEDKIQKNIELLKQDENLNFDIQSNEHISMIKPAQFHQSYSRQTIMLVTKNETHKFIQMQVSLLQGITKLIQRCFVMVLIFLSIIQNHHPFGIVYLICAILLTFLGAYSILSLSRVLTILITLQYLLMLTNYTNYNLFQTHIQQFKVFQYPNSFEFFIQLPDQWSEYLTFGDSTYEKIMLIISFVLLAFYQFYFVALNYAWFKILNSLTLKLSLNKVQKKIYDYFIMIYTYCLIYSPLCITICSLGIYLLDFTTTNLFLSILSIIFLFKSVLVEEYSESRLFWKLYFYILQFFIVIFMLIYDVLSIPMYNKYCIQILCSSQETHTKINKAVLLFVLQIGIDLMKSTYFITAMQNLKYTIKDQAIFSKLAIAYKQNDKKISKKFKDLTKQYNLTQNLVAVKQFLDKYTANPQRAFQNKKQINQTSQSWIDSLLQILPNFVDSSLILTSEQAKNYIKQQNIRWIKYIEISQKQLFKIKESYLDQFGQIENYQGLIGKINQVRQQRMQKIHQQSKYMPEMEQKIQRKYSLNRRKSLVDDIHNYQSEEMVRQRVNQLRESLAGQKDEQVKKQIQQTEKKKLVFLLVLESIISNWQYLTYATLILQHICNFGLLTLPFPILAFCYGLIHTYQASKHVWRLIFVLTILPISFKFAVAIGLIRLDSWLIYILIGDNTESILLQYFIILSVLIQCLILKIIGLYDEGVNDVEGMKMALIRNIVNSEQTFQIQHLKILLKNSIIMTQNNTQYIFCRYQQKPGYSYSTLMTTVQLLTLFFIFFFYDEMVARKQITIYQMISYNQFTAGMVILTLIQLFFLLAQRFVNIADLKEYSSKWELTLVAKYILLVIQLCYSEILIVFFFPYSSDNFSSNSYISIFYIFNVLTFLLSALQIKYGIDQQSKGFMDRYTWYNGFIYMAFRAVPFLFQFKIFSDWTFSKTSLRLFDWIKLEQIFGRMYVAKCNSLFLQGKQIGSKIQWWKKLLMGFPLLFAIILLLFGPLVLFSNLNPLASKNQISSGYLQLCLKINKTNQYPFYTNSHIANIANVSLSDNQKKMLQTYDIEQGIVQLIHLDQFSDQYWQISEGSYFKVLEQPESSLFQIILRIKFERNETGSTPMYTINTYTIPEQNVPLFKQTLLANATFEMPNFLDTFLRLDNNNGLHILGSQKQNISFHAEQAQRNNKMFWVINNGINIKIASDKYSKAIFGYSVMSFYISIILVIANYFRFLFQGSANGIILSDIPIADPILSLCNGIYQARFLQDIQLQETLFWTVIDLLRSPDQIKSLSGSYLQARLQTKQKQVQKAKDIEEMAQYKKNK